MRIGGGAADDANKKGRRQRLRVVLSDSLRRNKHAGKKHANWQTAMKKTANDIGDKVKRTKEQVKKKIEKELKAKALEQPTFTWDPHRNKKRKLTHLFTIIKLSWGGRGEEGRLGSQRFIWRERKGKVQEAWERTRERERTYTSPHGHADQSVCWSLGRRRR